MGRSVTIDVNADVLRWLRESSGWRKEEVSRKLKIPIDSVIELESGKMEPTLDQLQVLSKSFKCPLTSFLAPKLYDKKSMPKDYRSLPTVKKNNFEKETLVAIRNARYIQENSRELSENVKGSMKPEISQIAGSQSPETVSSKYKKKFYANVEKQRKISTPEELFNYLREQIEDLNILVLQFSMPIGDAGGFVLTDENPFTIVVNMEDSIEVRIFSLMHEFGHVLRNDTVIDMPGHPTKNKIEAWCNNFAASFLQLNANVLFREDKYGVPYARVLNELPKERKINKSSLVVGMERLAPMSNKERYNFTDLLVRKNTNNKTSIRKDPVEECIDRLGKKYVSVVMENLKGKWITRLDASHCLSIKTEYLERVFARTDVW